MLKNFEALERYRNQMKDHFKKQSEAQAKVRRLNDELEATKTEYEAEVAKGVQTGKPNDKKIEELDTKIGDLHKQLRRAEAELTATRALKYTGISKDDVLNAWNDEYLEYLREEHVQPVLEEVRAAKLAFIKAVMNYHRVMNEIEALRREVYQTIGTSTNYGNSHEYKVKSPKLHTQKEVEHYFLTHKDLGPLGRGELPENVTEEELK